MTRFGKHPGLLVRQQEPFNAGPAPALLARDFLTPNDLFFVRNHGGVPAVDPDSYRLSIEGLVDRPLVLSMAELKSRPKRTVTATLQCAGNRRRELMDVAPIPNELGWGFEAVGNASWGGVPLCDLLALAGPLAEGRHVAFAGLDTTERHGARFNFGGSVPLAKAAAPEVLLAYEMNGEPLPPVHGAPVRALVPGYIGARSVKWLARIVVQAEPSDNYFQSRAYRLFPPHSTAENVQWEQGMMLGEMSLNSVILIPAETDVMPAGRVVVRGFALAGPGRSVERVDLSIDGGGSWAVADLARETPGAAQTPETAAAAGWTWRLWESRVELGPGLHQLACRAWDSSAQTQPESPAQLWNFKGYMNNAWHRVRVRCRA
ncbi:MAG: molybdopterin-dependent oxidoreductase [Acidobacteriota bacterium]|nr:molybdopterin-dependent oxidoreductase [Acidobacteriota bacterium]